AQPDPVLRPLRCTPSPAPWCCLCTTGLCHPQKNAASLMPSVCRESRKDCGLKKADLLKCTGLPELAAYLPGFWSLRIEKTDLLQGRPIRSPVCLLAVRISIELCRQRIPCRTAGFWSCASKVTD